MRDFDEINQFEETKYCIAFVIVGKFPEIIPKSQSTLDTKIANFNNAKYVDFKI